MTPESNWKIFTHPQAVWEALLADFQSAQEYILLEEYIFNNDVVGAEFVDALKQKLLQGVRVYLLLDSVGSYLFSYSAAVNELTKHGAEVLFFNPISPWRLHTIFSWYFRDHRKIAVIDGKLGYTGGVGINARMRHWRDTMVRIDGIVVQEMENAFWGMWEIAKRGKFLKFPQPQPRAVSFNFISNSPHRRQRFYYYRFSDALRTARTRIYLCSPYFVPDLRTIRLLRLAARRGVDVQLLVPKRSDHQWLDLAASSYFGFLLRMNVSIFTYSKNVLHAKYSIVDDNWAAIGSTNLDNLSFTFNYEGNLVSSDPQFIHNLAGIFLHDKSESQRVTLQEWQNRSRWNRFLEFLTWPLHKFL